MNDCNGNELKVGDRVYIPCIIKDLPADAMLETVLDGRSGKDHFHSIDCRQLLKVPESDLAAGRQTQESDAAKSL